MVVVVGVHAGWSARRASKKSIKRRDRGRFLVQVVGPPRPVTPPAVGLALEQAEQERTGRCRAARTDGPRSRGTRRPSIGFGQLLKAATPHRVVPGSIIAYGGGSVAPQPRLDLKRGLVDKPGQTVRGRIPSSAPRWAASAARVATPPSVSTARSDWRIPAT